MTPAPPSIICITGPTASGKSELAFKLAQLLGAQIICADSVALYRGFDIGSAKPSLEQRKEVVHHGVDVLHPYAAADAGWYRTQMLPVLEELKKKSIPTVLVGGSWLYIKALLGRDFHHLPSDSTLRKELTQLSAGELYKELCQRDPVRAREIHPHDHFRLARGCEIARLSGLTMAELTSKQKDSGLFNSEEVFSVGLVPSLCALLPSIKTRTLTMLAQGWRAEVEDLLRQGVGRQARAMNSVGYIEIFHHIQKGGSEAQLSEAIITSTRQLARKQLRWLRRQSFNSTFTNAPPVSAQQIIEQIFTPC